MISYGPNLVPAENKELRKDTFYCARSDDVSSELAFSRRASQTKGIARA